jgi:hypothetical protein
LLGGRNPCRQHGDKREEDLEHPPFYRVRGALPTSTDAGENAQWDQRPAALKGGSLAANQRPSVLHAGGLPAWPFYGEFRRRLRL